MSRHHSPAAGGSGTASAGHRLDDLAACRSANAAWFQLVGRLPYRTHLEATRARQAALLVFDEAWFAAYGSPAGAR